MVCAEGKKYRQYTDDDKAAALLTLDFYGGNLHRVAAELSIPRKTLEEWARGRNQSPAVAKLRQLQGGDLADQFEDLVWQILGAITPEKMAKASFLECVRALGVLVDKMLQLRGCHCGAAHGRRGLKRVK